MARKRTIFGLGAAALMAFAFVAARVSEPTDAQSGASDVSATSARAATYTLECTGADQSISPLIYGVGGAGGDPWASGTTARRWGGNPTTRYNWEINAWNTAHDWYFRNVEGGGGYRTFLEENRQHGVKTAFTVPMIGWVAKDASSYSFPVAGFGKQQATAPELPDAGNGVGANGKPIPPGPATITSVPSTPETIARWVKQILADDGTRGRSVDSYILDNEPMLWNSTHRDVHPDPTTYDELLERTIAYGTAIRKADPDAKIAGPAEWGWQAYHYSAKDVASGLFMRPDRRMHGDEPLIPWYLKKTREYEEKSGVNILDILDVHFYPMGEGIGITTGGRTDPSTNARRLRATRSLWDPTYKDESWIDERMRVLPLLKEWIAANHPGLGISIGEWNFGAETHISGGLAVAEVLGRFGTEGVTSAYYWTFPQDKSPAFWAFRAFRNFDGEGGRFQDVLVPVKGSATLASVFASRDTARERVVAIVLNLSALRPLLPELTLQGCGTVASSRAFVYTGGEAGYKPMSTPAKGEPLKFTLDPYSITVIELKTEAQ